jgi:hypothetical protein
MEKSVSVTKSHQSAIYEMMNGRWEVEVEIRGNNGDLVPYEPSHLPTHLKRRRDGIRNQLQYHLRAVAELMAQHGESLQRDVEEWAEVAYYHSPAELIVDDDWINYFPGIVMSDKPYTALAEAIPNTEAEQRLLTTQLLTGGITKKKKESILAKSQKLLCSLDCRDEVFFPESILYECLEREGLDTDAKINSRLGRKPYTPIRKAERRGVLADIWEERIARTKLKHNFQSEDWESFGLEDIGLKTFTWFALESLLNTISGYGRKDLELGLFSLLREAQIDGELSEYYLDPRDEDTWVGLVEFLEALKKADTDAFHYSYQSGECEGQRWLFCVGLPALYGQTAEWWSEFSAVVKGSCDQEDELLLLGKAQRSGYEEVVLFKHFFTNSISDGGVRGFCAEKYREKMREVVENA